MSRTTRKLIFSALLAALCCVITMFPKFPTPLGYIHGGDALVLLAAFVLGPGWGAAAAGLGSALADLLAGYAQYVPGTFVIKALMALLAGGILRALRGKRPLTAGILAGLPAELAMVGGYLLYEWRVLGYGAAALGVLPTNALQAAFGVAAGAAFYAALMRSPYFRRFFGVDGPGD